MKNRLSPAFSKHLKPAPQPVARPAPRVQNNDEMFERAKAHREKGELREAEQLCFRLLKLNPNNPQALYLAGMLALDVQDDDLAFQFLHRAIKEKPKEPYFHLALAAAHENAGEFEPAIKHFHRALALKPNLVGALCGLGLTYVKSGNAELALPFYEKALKFDRDYKAARMGYANALTSLGRMDEAVACLKEAIGRRRQMPWAYNAFAGTRKFSSEPAELKSILAELNDPALPPTEANQLHHAAGKILNDLKRYDEAVDHFQKAKIVSGRDFDIEAYRGWVDSMIDVFNPAMLKARADFGDSSEVPVFVVGMPRSGTTLTEQICASHPGVHGAGELSKLRRVAHSIGFSNASLEAFRKSVMTMNRDKSRALAADYLSYLRRLSPEALRIIDKMPHNFETIGFIALLFPKAHIIHCRRDAIDTCVSCFMTSFNDKHGYNADLHKLGLYYREYDRLMHHWNTLLPGRIYECRYETMIADQEAESRRLIDHLGLPWDDACLRFYEQDRAVNTPSRWQVRQPVYTSSVRRWKNYEGKIQPLVEALGDLAEV
jgi:tetratricopeptide (TPR) repeat protein